MFFIPHQGKLFRLLANLTNWQRNLLLFYSFLFGLWLLYKFNANTDELPKDRFRSAHDKLQFVSNSINDLNILILNKSTDINLNCLNFVFDLAKELNLSLESCIIKPEINNWYKKIPVEISILDESLEKILLFLEGLQKYRFVMKIKEFNFKKNNEKINFSCLINFYSFKSENNFEFKTSFLNNPFLFNKSYRIMLKGIADNAVFIKYRGKLLILRKGDFLEDWQLIDIQKHKKDNILRQLVVLKNYSGKTKEIIL